MKLYKDHVIIPALILFTLFLVFMFIYNLVNYRYICVYCKERIDEKGTEIFQGRFLCPKCWSDLSFRALQELDHLMPTAEKWDKEVMNKVRDYLKEE